MVRNWEVKRGTPSDKGTTWAKVAGGTRHAVGRDGGIVGLCGAEKE